ncbi:TetR/AcrR family transcriptional regulator [Plantactinospora endophytica]|uniref:TetR/AcrR family transcriptional regulator n=1 Tax=Plantactinospora endophytica TaxID=673535 RepID=UPI0019457163|nr:TetR/AcrR family transcriptional regulator [Plantactinospora endophytica]
MTSQTPSGRARPLPPEERRAALITATLALITEHGIKVTTRQIAEAAGVAEGTIFRVFPHKDGLVRVAVETALDPAPLLAELAELDLDIPLRERLTRLAAILQLRLTSIFNLLHSVGMHGPPEDSPAGGAKLHPPNEQIYQAIVRVLEPDRDRFRYPLPEVARLLRLLTFAGSHPRITDNEPLSPELIAAVLLDGVREPGAADPDRPAEPSGPDHHADQNPSGPATTGSRVPGSKEHRC